MEFEKTISMITGRLKHINGVKAIVLGGSRARGSHNPHSDIDIGIYYEPTSELDLQALQQAATDLDDAGRSGLVTEIGAWGPWINGGGWLVVNQCPVDFLFRDLHRVSAIVEQCRLGQITVDYQPGHPHGFMNTIYFSEIALCKVLWDPSGMIEKMKSRTTPYPSELKTATIRKFFWEAGFALDTGRKGIHQTDLAYIAGCCFRSLSCLNQVLFAVNEVYLMNEKGAAAIADSLQLTPKQYANRVNNIVSLITEDREQLHRLFHELRELIDEVESILKSELLLN